MAARTYVPTFRDQLHFLNIYVSKYSALMTPHITVDQIEALAEFVVCLANVIAAFGPNEVED